MTREILRERGRNRDGKRNTERGGVKEKQRDIGNMRSSR